MKKNKNLNKKNLKIFLITFFAKLFEFFFFRSHTLRKTCSEILETSSSSRFFVSFSSESEIQVT
jgi:hypothetical protein